MQDIAIFVFQWPSWQSSWIFKSLQPSNQFVDPLIEFGFLDPENIQLDTQIIFLYAVESKIWLFLYFGGHIGSHLGFF